MTDFAKFIKGTPAIKHNIKALLALKKLIKYRVMTPKPNSPFELRARVHDALKSHTELTHAFNAVGWTEDVVAQKLAKKCHGA